MEPSYSSCPLVACCDTETPQYVKAAQTIKATKQKIGKNNAATFGKCVADMLKLPNHEIYTGHCWRHTSITFMADAGMVTSIVSLLR
jgi:hypothetical protein